jgi:hypothetical protein
MAQARRRADEAGAKSLSGYVTAASVAGEAGALFDQGAFVQAAGKFKAAAEGFEGARREAQRLAQQSRPEPSPAPPPPDPSKAEAAREAMARARRQAEATEGAAALGSYVVAAGMAREGDAFFGQENYDLAAAKYGSAAEGFDAARREAARLAEQKAKVPVPAPPPVTAPAPAPQPVAAPPKPVDETPAIQEIVRKYEDVFERKDLGLYQQIKPNVSPKELETLQRVFSRVDSYEVSIEINKIQIDGNEASVSILRQDTIDGRSQGRNPQVLFLTKSAARGWIIERLGQ